MIHEIMIETQARLRAQGCPIECVDGPPWGETSWSGERIVFTLDDGGDSFETVRGGHVNPKQVTVRMMAFTVRIYAQAKKAGAMFFEHTRRADAILDQVLVALSEACQVRKQPVQFRGGKWLPIKDLEKSTVFAGAVYELSAVVPRGVTKKDWDGDALEEITITEGLIKNTVKARLQGTADDDDDPITVPATAETVWER